MTVEECGMLNQRYPRKIHTVAVVGRNLLPLPPLVPQGEGDTLRGTALDIHMHPLLAEPEATDTVVGDHNMHRVVSGKPDIASDIHPLLIE